MAVTVKPSGDPASAECAECRRRGLVLEPAPEPSSTLPAPTHTIALIAERVTAVLVTHENIRAIAAACQSKVEHEDEPQPTFMAELPSGVSHEFATGDYLVRVPGGVWPIYGEDVGQIFVALPLEQKTGARR